MFSPVSPTWLGNSLNIMIICQPKYFCRALTHLSTQAPDIPHYFYHFIILNSSMLSCIIITVSSTFVLWVGSLEQAC
jgi:hypothetical protein